MEHLNAERERTVVCIGGKIIPWIYYPLAEKIWPILCDNWETMRGRMKISITD